jgi:hypothetical protein
MKPDPSVTQYWQIVQACMVELYRIPDETAADRIQSLTKGGRAYASPRDLIYHAAPIHAASDLAGKKMPASDAFWRRYQRLLERHGIPQQIRTTEAAPRRVAKPSPKDAKPLTRVKLIRVKQVTPEPVPEKASVWR